LESRSEDARRILLWGPVNWKRIFSNRLWSPEIFAWGRTPSYFEEIYSYGLCERPFVMSGFLGSSAWTLGGYEGTGGKLLHFLSEAPRLKV